MRELLQLVPTLLDPRGRCNRKGLLIIASLMLAIEVALGLAVWGLGMSFTGTPATLFKLLFCWLAICACSKRLHDIGLGAGMLGWGLLATIVWTLVVGLAVALGLGIEQLMPSGRWYVAAMAISMLPVVLAMLWLHLAKGQVGTNAYGAEPTGLGFSIMAYQPAGVRLT